MKKGPKSFKIGRRVLYAVEDIETFVAAARQAVSPLRAEPTHDESRPSERAALSVHNGDLHSVPRTADHLADLDGLAESLRGYLVMQVVVDDAGHRRTNLYRSAAAAQRAVERARSRGRAVHVSLCQLLPVGVVQGLEVA